MRMRACSLGTTFLIVVGFSLLIFNALRLCFCSQVRQCTVDCTSITGGQRALEITDPGGADRAGDAAQVGRVTLCAPSVTARATTIKCKTEAEQMSRLKVRF